MKLVFLIPTYQRVSAAERAALSILNQIDEFSLGNLVSVWINDDASPDCTAAEYFATLSGISAHKSLTITRNSSNLGMSKNIYYMVQNSFSDYWTVLSDDDLLRDNSLLEIMSLLNFMDLNQSIHTAFAPRQCISEDGQIQFIDCSPPSLCSPSIINADIASSLQYMRCGYILTGLIASRKVDCKLWNDNIYNSFFPVINYGSSLLFGDSIFLNKSWFYHTVNNETYWDSWGSTKFAQSCRLASDYLDAQKIVYLFGIRKYLKSGKISLLSCLKYFYHYCAVRTSYILEIADTFGFRSLSIFSSQSLAVRFLAIWILMIHLIRVKLRAVFRAFEQVSNFT